MVAGRITKRFGAKKQMIHRMRESSFPYLSILTIAIIMAGALGFAILLRLHPVPDIRAKSCTRQSSAMEAGRVFHVDPAKGSDDGDGTVARPWRSLQAMVDAGLIGETVTPHTLLDRILAKLSIGYLVVRPRDNSRVRVHAGDTILVHSGRQGAVDLSGLGNSGYVTIAAAPGPRPELSSLKFDAASHFRIRGFAITSDVVAGDKLVSVGGVPGMSLPDNIVLDDLDVGPRRSIGDFSREDWLKQGAMGVRLNGHCLELTRSHIHDVRYGAVLLRASATRLTHTKIRNFSVDAIAYSGTDLVIADNEITDHWQTGDDRHPDCMQGQSTDDSVLNGPLLIENNICIVRTQAREDPGEWMQGINSFAGRWHDVTVRCNRVLASAGHGIAFYGVDRATITDNVVIGLYPEWPSWIVAFPAKTGRQPTNNVIRGNVASGYLNAALVANRLRRETSKALNVEKDPKIMGALYHGISGVRLGDNSLLVRGNGWVRQPADPRLREIVMAQPPQGMDPAQFRNRFPLPATCGSGAAAPGG